MITIPASRRIISSCIYLLSYQLQSSLWIPCSAKRSIHSQIIRRTLVQRPQLAFLTTMPIATRSQLVQQDSNESPPVTISSAVVVATPTKRRFSARQVTPEKVESFAEPDSPPPSALKKKRTASPKKKRATSPEPLSRAPPANWEEIYSIVEELRKDRTAPCDKMGAEAMGALGNGDVRAFRFQVLLALLLSSQTKDAVVGEAVRNLQQDNLLSVEALRQAHVTTKLLADKHFAKVGFRNNKAKYLKQVVEILHEQYDGDIPPNADKMMELPGIGPKMAYIAEAVAWNPEIPSGIGVDTHMHRLFNQLKWVNSKTPEQTRVQLQSWLPQDKWKTVNLLWVGFGQQAQQEKEVILNYALKCSRPTKALRLLKRCGVDLKKEGAKYGLTDQIQAALKQPAGKGEE